MKEDQKRDALLKLARERPHALHAKLQDVSCYFFLVKGQKYSASYESIVNYC